MPMRKELGEQKNNDDELSGVQRQANKHFLFG
jgi:hypothetical protein